MNPQGFRKSGLAIVGRVEDNIREALESGVAPMARVLTRAVRASVRDLRDEWRGQARDNFGRVARRYVPQAARGQNLVKAVRETTYPQNADSLGPAGLVHINSRLAEVFGAATIISAASGRWLAIPTEEAFKRGYVRAPVERGAFGRFQEGSLRRQARPDLARRALGALGVKLRFVQTEPGQAFLGIDADDADDLGLRNARRRVGPKGARRRTRFVPLFVLVKQVTLRQRFDFDRSIEQASDRLTSVVRWVAEGGAAR